MLYAIIGGIWLSLLYSATVMPATIRVIQMTVSRNWIIGMMVSLGLALGQLPWCLLASILLFQFPAFWISIDLPIRFGAVLFLAWMSYRTSRARNVETIQLHSLDSPTRLLWLSLHRSLTMPWRLPLWACIILSVGIHLRGPGWNPAMVFSIAAVLGQLLWCGHFVVIATMYGRRVPEEICLHSMNKLRFLATVVLAGLALIILAPLAFPPS